MAQLERRVILPKICKNHEADVMNKGSALGNKLMSLCYTCNE